MKILKRKVIFMRNIDPKSLCIGFLGAALIFTITNILRGLITTKYKINLKLVLNLNKA